MILRILWAMLKLSAFVVVGTGINNSIKVHSNDLLSVLYGMVRGVFGSIFGIFGRRNATVEAAA